MELKNDEKICPTENVKNLLTKISEDVTGNSIPNKIQSKRLQEKAKVLNKGRISLEDLLRNISERNEKFGFLSSTVVSPKSCGTRENKSLSPKCVQPCGSKRSNTLPQKSAKPCPSKEKIHPKCPRLHSSPKSTRLRSSLISTRLCSSLTNTRLRSSTTTTRLRSSPTNKRLYSSQGNKSLSPKCVQPCGSKSTNTLPQKSAKPCPSEEKLSPTSTILHSSQENKSLSLECVQPCGSQGSDTSSEKPSKPCTLQENKSSPECVQPCGSQGSDTLPEKQSKPCTLQQNTLLSLECVQPCGLQGSDTSSQQPSKPCTFQENKSLSLECVQPCGSQGNDTSPEKQSKPCILQQNTLLSLECVQPCGSQGNDTSPEKQSKPCTLQENMLLSLECVQPCGSQGNDTSPEKQSKPCILQQNTLLSLECVQPCGSQGNDTSPEKQSKPCTLQENMLLSLECVQPCGSQGSDTLSQKRAQSCASPEKKSLSSKCVQPCEPQEIDAACSRYAKPCDAHEKKSFPSKSPEPLLFRETESLVPKDVPSQTEKMSPKNSATHDTLTQLDKTLSTTEKFCMPIQELVITSEIGLEKSKVLETKSDQISEKIPIPEEVEKVKTTQRPVLEIGKSDSEANSMSYGKNDEKNHGYSLQKYIKCSITSRAEMEPVVLLEKLPSWINQYRKIIVSKSHLQPMISEEKDKQQKKVQNMASSIIFLADKIMPKCFKGNTSSFGKQQGYKLLSQLSKKNRDIMSKQKKQLICPNKRLTRSQREEVKVDFNAKLPDYRQVKPRMFRDGKMSSFFGFNIPFGLLKLPDHYLVYKSIFDSYRDEGCCIDEVMGAGHLDMKSKTVYLTGKEDFFKTGQAISKDLTEEITPTKSADIKDKYDAFSFHRKQFHEPIGQNDCGTNGSAISALASSKEVAETDNLSDSQAACKTFLSSSQKYPSKSNSKYLDEVNSIATDLNCSSASSKPTSENKTDLTHELIKKPDGSQSDAGKSDFFGENERSCVKDFCHLGCICESLEVRERVQVHCGHERCMFSTSCCIGSNVPVTSSDQSKLLLLSKSNASPDEEIVRSRRKRKAPKRLFEEDMIFDMNFIKKNLSLHDYSPPSKKINHERITDCSILLTKFHLYGADVRCLNHLRLNCFCLKEGKTRNVAIKSTSCSSFKRPSLNVALKSTSQRLLVRSQGTLCANTHGKQPVIKQNIFPAVSENTKKLLDTKEYVPKDGKINGNAKCRPYKKKPVPKKSQIKNYFSNLKEFQETVTSEEITIRDLDLMCSNSLDYVSFNTVKMVKITKLDDLMSNGKAFMWLRYRFNQKIQVFVTKMLSAPDFACVSIRNLYEMTKIFNATRSDDSSLTCCIITGHDSYWEVIGTLTWIQKSSNDMLMTSNSLNSFGDFSLLTHSSRKDPLDSKKKIFLPNMSKKLAPAKERTIGQVNIWKELIHQNSDVSYSPIPMTSSTHFNLSDGTKLEKLKDYCHSAHIKPDFQSVSAEKAQFSTATILKNDPDLASNHENCVWYRLDLNGEFDELAIEETSFWVTHAQLVSAFKISKEKNRVVRVSFDAVAKDCTNTWRQNIYVDPSIDNVSVRIGPYFSNERTRIKTFKNLGGVLEPTVHLLKMIEYKMKSNDFLNVQAVEHIYKDVNLDEDIEKVTHNSSSLVEVMKCNYPDPNIEDNISPEDEEPGFTIKIADVQGNWAGFNDISSTCDSVDKTLSSQMTEDSTKFSGLSYISKQPLISNLDHVCLNNKCVEGKDILVANMHPVQSEIRNHLFPIKSKDSQELISVLKKDPPTVLLKRSATVSLTGNCTIEKGILTASIPLEKDEMRSSILPDQFKKLQGKFTSVIRKDPPKIVLKKSATAGVNRNCSKQKGILRVNMHPRKDGIERNLPAKPKAIQNEFTSVLRKDPREVPVKDSATAGLKKDYIDTKSVLICNEPLKKDEIVTIVMPDKSEGLQSKVTIVSMKKESKIPVEASANAKINENGFEEEGAHTDNVQPQKNCIQTHLFHTKPKVVKIKETLPKQEPYSVSQKSLAECSYNGGNIMLGYLVPDIPGIHPIPVARGGMTNLEKYTITMKDPMSQDGDTLHFLDLGSANLFLNQSILKVVNFFPVNMTITWAFVKVTGKDSIEKFDGLMELKELSRDMFITGRGVFYYDKLHKTGLQRAGINKKFVHRFMEAKRRREIYYGKRELEEVLELRKSSPLISVIEEAHEKINILEKKNVNLDVQRTNEALKKTRLLTRLGMLCTNAQYRATLKRLQDMRRKPNMHYYGFDL